MKVKSEQELKLIISSYFDSVVAQIDYYTEKTIAESAEHRDNELFLTKLNQRREKQIRMVKEMESKNLANVVSIDLKEEYEKESQLMEKLFKEFCFTSEHYGRLVVIVTGRYRSESELKLFQTFLKTNLDTEATMKAFTDSAEFTKLIQCGSLINSNVWNWTSRLLKSDDDNDIYFHQIDDLFTGWCFHFLLYFNEINEVDMDNLDKAAATAQSDRSSFRISALELGHDSGVPCFHTVKRIVDMAAEIKELSLSFEIRSKEELFELVGMLQRVKNCSSIEVKLTIPSRVFIGWFYNYLLRPQIVQKFKQLSEVISKLHLVVLFVEDTSVLEVEEICGLFVSRFKEIGPKKRVIELSLEDDHHKLSIDEADAIELHILEEYGYGGSFEFRDIKKSKWIKEKLTQLTLEGYTGFNNQTLTKSDLADLSRIERLDLHGCELDFIAPDALSHASHLNFLDIQNIKTSQDKWDWSFLAPVKSQLTTFLWNHIYRKEISYRIFEGMSSLKNLIVMNEHIESIELDSDGCLFPTLTNLDSLILDIKGWTCVSSPVSYEKRHILRGLVNLKFLQVSFRDQSAAYHFLCESDPEFRLASLESMSLIINAAREGGQQLSKECFRSFPNIKTLKIEVPSLEVIEPGAFSYLSKLQVLSVKSSNGAQSVINQPSLFDGLVSLRVLQTNESSTEKADQFVYFSNLNRFVLVVDSKTNLPSIE